MINSTFANSFAEFNMFSNHYDKKHFIRNVIRKFLGMKHEYLSCNAWLLGRILPG